MPETPPPDRFARAIALIDAANAADPAREEGEPAALLYGRRMSTQCDRLFPAAGEILRLACRGQHVERWLLAREAYPAGKAGYLDWRREQARRHAARMAAILAAAGYPEAAGARIGTLLRKEGLKRDPEVQALEDVACFTFLQWYFAPFAAGREAAQIRDIVAKTARKMSPAARDRALAEFALPADLAAALRGEPGGTA